MIFYRCDRCKAEEQAGKTGAKPTGWTIGTGADLCPKCSASTPKGDCTVIKDCAAAREEKPR